MPSCHFQNIFIPQLEKENYDFFPLNRALSLQQEEDNNEIRLETLMSQVSYLVNKMKEEVFGRFAEHLDNNGIDIKKTRATAGPLLNFDPDKEIFTGDLADEANKLVKGDYREGFTIPEVV